MADVTKNGRYLSTKEVATLWHVSPPAVAKWIREKKLKAYTTPGGHYRVAEEELARFAEQTGAQLPGFGREEAARPTWRVLIVDDDPILLEFMSDALGAAPESFEIRTADNGYDVGSVTSMWEPDLLIIDLLMPGMNGFEVCTKLSQAASVGAWTPKILAVTGFGSDDTLSRALASGAHDWLTKPFSFTELLHKVRLLLELPGEEEDGAEAAPHDRRRSERQDLCVPVLLSDLSHGTMLGRGHTLDVSRAGIKAKISDFSAECGKFRADIHLVHFGQPIAQEVACCWSMLHGNDETTIVLGLRLERAPEELSNLLQAAALLERHHKNLAFSSLRS